MADLIGKTISGYQIIEQIGRGGMANVYKAFQPSLERYVAVKVLPAYYSQQDDAFIQRFKREAKAIASLRHPNILIVMDYGEDEEIPYIVMEYVEAGTLKEAMETPMKLSKIAKLLGQIADALDYAHKEGVIHRDVKPSNVLMPKPDWALLTDFGLAKMVGGSFLTQSGMTVGTPAYMSPEQGGGDKVDARSDIYSLGIILYEMVTGEVPYTAETPMAVVVKHIVDPLPLPRARNPNLPEAVERVILKALAKKPEDRYSQAGEITEALNAIAAEIPDWSAEVPRKSDPEATTEIDQGPTKITPNESDARGGRVKSKDNQTLAKPRRTMRVAGILGVLALLIAVVGFGGFALWNQFGANSPEVQTDDPPPPFNGVDIPRDVSGNPMRHGEELLAAGNLDGAMQAFESGILRDARGWQEFILIVDDLYRVDGEVDLAVTLLENGLEWIDFESPEEVELLGVMQFESGNYPAAAETFRKAIEIDPSYEPAYGGLVEVYTKVDEVGVGIKFLEELREIYPEEANIHSYLAEFNYYAFDDERAIESLQKAVELDPDNPLNYVRLADSYLELENYAEAEDALNAAFERAENDPGVYEAIGWTALDLGDYDLAEEAFNKMGEHDPDNSWVYMGLATTYIYSGKNLDDVPGLLERAVETGEEDPFLYDQAGWAWMDYGDCERAIEYFELALEHDPSLIEEKDAISECGG